MYLSRLILDPKSREVRRDLANCHEMHRTLLKGFPETPEGVSDPRNYFGVLFRVESDRRTGLPKVYVQSTFEPDWSKLPKNYLADMDDNPVSKSVLHQYERLQAGTVLSFILKANPTRKVGTMLKCDKESKREGKNGHRVFLRRTEDQIAWLLRKAEQNGFELLSIKIDSKTPDLIAAPAGEVYGWKSSKSDLREENHRLTFGSVNYSGHLRIKDRDQFLQGIRTGVGSGKAYGFGMLSLAPAR